MFVKTLVLLALASVVLGNPGRIAGGRPVALGEIPFQVSIQDRNGQHFCGGAIVDAQFVLTSASCVAKISGQVNVVAGTVLLTAPAFTTRAQTINNYPDYGMNGTIPYDDLAMLKVNPIFLLGANIARAIVPSQGFEVAVDTNCTVAGWGTTSLGGGSSNELLRVEVPVVDTDECAMVYPALAINQICAGLEEGGADACDRDNGSPLFLTGVIYGLFSWGGGCGSVGYPGVYTEVAMYADWIRQIIAIG